MDAEKNYSRICNERGRKKIRKVFFPIEPKKFIDEKIILKGEVLDFGCGINSFYYSKTKKDGGKYTGFDLDEETVKWLKEKRAFFDFWKEEKQFDFIIASHVYEHLEKKEREKFIKRSLKLLKKEGHLLVGFPNALNLSGLEYWKDKTHEVPPSPFDEGNYIELFGFSTETILIGISVWPPHNFFRLIANLLLGFSPQHYCLVLCKKN
ncbi:MAG: class I SAM-dependent methyltransferase [archaeon]